MDALRNLRNGLCLLLLVLGLSLSLRGSEIAFAQGDGPEPLGHIICTASATTPWRSGNTVFANHTISCGGVTPRISVFGYLTKDGNIVTLTFNNTCYNTTSCTVQSFKAGSSGLWHAWTGGSYRDHRDNAYNVPQKRSPGCLTY